MNPPEDPETPGIPIWEKEYHAALGTFHGMWSTIDVTTDFAIGRFLRVTYEQAHLITSGMMFGTKARLLMDLIHRSDHPKRKELLDSFGSIRGNSKRDIVVHGYQMSSNKRIAFLERSRGGNYTGTQHVFTRDEFFAHLDRLIEDGHKFYAALGASDDEMEAFVEAAISPPKKSKARSKEPRRQA